MNIAAQYQQNIDEHARTALRDAIAQHPTTSVADLRELVAANPSLGAVTLSELLGGKARAVQVRGKAPNQFVSLKDKPAAGSRPAKGVAWDTRTEVGRETLDHAVLEAIAAFGGIGVSAEAIRARVGGTAAQVRTSLNRQIAAGDLSFSGKARGTRYLLES